VKEVEEEDGVPLMPPGLTEDDVDVYWGQAYRRRRQGEGTSAVREELESATTTAEVRDP
jgi:hypothetical protein